MAIRQCATSENGFRNFSSRLPKNTFDEVTQWAWKNRLTFTAAIDLLLSRALAAEAGGAYQRYSQSAPPAQSAIPGGDFKAAFNPAQTPPQKRDYGVPSSFKEAFIAPSDDGEEPYQY